MHGRIVLHLFGEPAHEGLCHLVRLVCPMPSSWESDSCGLPQKTTKNKREATERNKKKKEKKGGSTHMRLHKNWIRQVSGCRCMFLEQMMSPFRRKQSGSNRLLAKRDTISCHWRYMCDPHRGSHKPRKSAQPDRARAPEQASKRPRGAHRMLHGRVCVKDEGHVCRCLGKQSSLKHNVNVESQCGQIAPKRGKTRFLSSTRVVRSGCHYINMNLDPPPLLLGLRSECAWQGRNCSRYNPEADGQIGASRRKTS